MDVYYAVLAGYNEDWRWIAFISVAASVIAILAVARADQLGHARVARATFVLLSVQWLWVGIAHQAVMMADYNFMAPVYAGFWCLGSLSFAWAALKFCPDGVTLVSPPARWPAIGFMVLGLGLSPALVTLFGPSIAGLPWVGLAPDPTALFTAGVLMLMVPSWTWCLWTFPLLWMGVSALTAWLWMSAASWPVPMGIMMAFVGGLMLNRGQTRAS